MFKHIREYKLRMMGKWLGGDLEDWFFMEASVATVWGQIFLFSRETGFGTSQLLTLIPIDPRQAKVSK